MPLMHDCATLTDDVPAICSSVRCFLLGHVAKMRYCHHAKAFHSAASPEYARRAMKQARSRLLLHLGDRCPCSGLPLRRHLCDLIQDVSVHWIHSRFPSHSGKVDDTRGQGAVHVCTRRVWWMSRERQQLASGFGTSRASRAGCAAGRECRTKGDPSDDAPSVRHRTHALPPCAVITSPEHRCDQS